MARHKEATFPQGDTWVIAGKLFGRDGNPLPLSGGVFLEWALLDDTRAVTIRATSENGIAITDAEGGLIEITLSADTTEGIAPGAYSDALRANVAGMVATMWNGPVIVEASPFNS
jgi:hypothetical protein